MHIYKVCWGGVRNIFEVGGLSPCVLDTCPSYKNQYIVGKRLANEKQTAYVRYSKNKHVQCWRRKLPKIMPNALAEKT